MELSEIARRNFVYWMKSQGRQQKWVAQQLGVTENTVSRWKSGKLELSLGQIGKIAELMGLPVPFMFVEDGAKSPEEAAKVLTEIVSNS
jgi:transcriptional regulator with XRE-family HTH domain